MNPFPFELAGESLLLLAEKAIFWPREHMLIIADIHFGKAASFRALGVPVPHGTTTQNLSALDSLIEGYGVRQIVFLGDFLHARSAHASATLEAMVAWRVRNPLLAMTLVRGNHDVHAGDPSTRLVMRMVDEPYCVGPFAFCHHPDVDAPGYVLAGHVHPVFRLNSRGDTLRLPCFLIGPTRAVLPSFGAFTGGFQVAPKHGERVFVTTGDGVFAVVTRPAT